MRRSFHSSTTLAIAGAGIFALGCADATRTPPTAAAPAIAAPAPGAAAPAAVCNFSAIRSDARAYVGLNDPIFDLIDRFETAYRAGNPAATLDAGLTVLRRIALVRKTNAAKLPLDGARTAVGVIVCSGELRVPSVANLASALANDSSGGVFEVRGGSGDPTGPAVAPSAAFPLWGAEPQPASTWPATFGKRALLYAFRITFAQFTNEAPALPTSGGGSPTAFDMNTIPHIATLPNPLVVGVCVNDPSSFRLQHVDTIVALTQLSFCTTTTSSREAGAGPLSSLGRRLLAWVAPRPLYAAPFMFIGGTAGLISGFSPKGAVAVETNLITLRFGRAPSQTVNVPFTATITARTENGYPIDAILVKLFIADSSGVYQPVPVTPVSTANGGVATFTISVGTPGSYTLRADGFFNGDPNLPTKSGFSDSFVVKP